MTATNAFLARIASRALEAAAVVAVLLLAHRFLDLPPRQIPDHGMPDALFYSRAGASLAAGSGYSIRVNGADLPPKFPPGASLLLAAGYAAGAKTRADALPVVHALAALLGLLAWWGARRLAGPWAGLAALIALQGGLCMTSFRNQMASDVPACLVPLGLALLLARPRPGYLRLLAAGLLAGCGLLLRYPLVAAAPSLLLLLELGRRGFARRVGLVCLGAMLPAAALLAWHWIAFGSPFRTGYSLWLPDFHQAGRAVFSLDYALKGPALGAMRGPNWSYYLGLLAGRLALLHTWPVALGLLAGLPFLLARGARPEARRFLAFTLSFCLANYVLYTFYFFQESRLLLPLSPLLGVAAAAGLAAAASALAGRSRPWVRAAARLAPLALAPAALLFAAQVAAQRERFISAAESIAACEAGRLVPRGAILLTGRDLLLLAGEAPEVELLPLSPGQEWAQALAWRDRRLARPEEDRAATGAWAARLAAGPLPAAEARAMLAPPLPASLDYLREEAHKGRPIYLEPDQRAWALLEPYFRRQRIESPVLELWRLAPRE